MQHGFVPAKSVVSISFNSHFPYEHGIFQGEAGKETHFWAKVLGHGSSRRVNAHGVAFIGSATPRISCLVKHHVSSIL